MRRLWPIERAILEAAISDYPALAEILRQQIDAAQVAEFKNTGAGFFSTLSVSAHVPRLPDKSPLDVGLGSVAHLEHGMGFLLFLKDGYVHLIEAYTFGPVSTVGLEFEKVQFAVKPWSIAGR